MSNVAFHELPASKFPFTAYAYPEDSEQDVDPVWTIRVAGPGGMQIPGLQEIGQRVRLVLKFADGTEER